MQEKNATFEESFFSFKKFRISLEESRKGGKRRKMIGKSFSIMFCAYLIMMALKVPAGAKSFVQPLQWERWEGIGSLIFLLPVLIWFCLLTPLPILWGLRSFKERKLRKIRQKLEKKQSR
ncbi:hypothetical protein [Bartonella queenslandensis]|uniref:hypothetical protein n=1 Tax=Bartonella queenslandensis TaxID=481138 RepID=UPI001BA90130|nr:hypothetical protein [Bartonella queenslandensis]